ncbi:MAG: amidoligase family protein, partial [Verrucomicrobia bacterium]|nr:amidoligase family protein [Verrucomicrobiota bacterium]
MQVRKSQDHLASQIQWGIELETSIPAASGVIVGAYHNGSAVQCGVDPDTAMPLAAPAFAGQRWRAERDGSIRPEPGHVACEFVSPILHGEAGVQHLLSFVNWANAIGGQVNDSCGCHITVGIESVIGTDDPKAVSEFIRKLAHISRWHARSLYGQTGTGRHLNHYSHPLFEDTGSKMRKLVTSEEERIKAECAT